METSPTARDPVRVPFRCPFCTAEQSVDLVALAKAGSATCAACKRRLGRAKISEAIARTRPAARSGGAGAGAGPPARPRR